MPKWRKLSTKTAESVDLNDMPDDFTRLLWLFLWCNCVDCEGRCLDNSSLIKSRAMPLRADVTTKQIEKAMDWYTKRGMISRYEVNGRRYFWIPTFREYQGDTSRESPSLLPSPELATKSRPTHDLLMTNSSSDTDTDTDTDTDLPAQAPTNGHEPNPFKESEELFSIAEALAEVCVMDFSTNRPRLFRAAKTLKGKNPALMRQHYGQGGWWYLNDWRGLKAQPPSPAQVAETWGQWEKVHTRNKGSPVGGLSKKPNEPKPIPWDKESWAKAKGRSLSDKEKEHMRAAGEWEGE